jgi:hypothetical protein
MPEKHPEQKSSKVEAGKVRVFVTYKESGIKLAGETYFPTNREYFCPMIETFLL